MMKIKLLITVLFLSATSLFGQTVTFTTQPTDQTAIDGETATFTVAAESYADGSEWTQFAWQVSSDEGANWFDILGGSTTNTLSVTAAIGNDGDMYRAAGTSGSGFNINWHEFSEAATLTVVEAPTVVFTTQPTDQTAIDGETATFTVAAEAYADGTEWTQFAWQVSSDGGANWFDVIGGPNTNSITVTASIANDGDMYRAAGTSGSGFFITWHEFSEAATLTIVEAPTVVFTTQPTDQTAIDGETATFTVAAEAYADGTEWTQFAWQVSSDEGANWFDVLGGSTTNTLSVTASIANDGDMYRAAGTSGSGFFITWHEFSEAATLTIVEAPTVVFTTQPTDQTAIDGETATFTVAAEAYADGTEWTQFAWQVSSDGGANWFDVIGGPNTNSITVTASIANDGDMYRAAGTSGSGFFITWHEFSEAATLTIVEAPTVVFTTQPTDQTAIDGETATFTVAAEAYADGTEWTQFAWQVSSDGGANWFDVIGGPNTNSITVTASIANDGDMYRAAGTSGSGFFITWHEFSEAATLTIVEAPTVVFTTQPTDQTAIDGETATFTVAAEAYADGTEWTQFAWQVSSDGGTNWFDVIGGPNTNSITVTASIANDGDMYRAAGTSGSGFFITWHEFSEAATLTIVEAPTVVFTTQPTDQTAIDGETATFTVAAEAYADGTEWTQFAWQVSSDGGANWFDVIGGPNTNSITVTASIANDGDMYRAAGTSGSGFFITWHEFSEAATLTVVEAPTVVFTTQPTDQTAIDGETATFTVAAEAYADGTEWTQFAWQVSSDGGANWFDVIGGPNTNSITVTASIANDGDMYRAAGTSGSGFFISWHEFSEGATLTIVEAPTVVFTTQPTDQTAIDGETATFTVAAEAYADGTEWTQFAWQVSSDGGTNWFDVIGGPNTNSITVTASIANDGDMYRAAGTSGSGFFITWHEFSEAATLTIVEAPTVVFTTQPTDQTAIDGETATFTVAAEAYADGTEWTQFAWQVSSDGGTNWFDVIGGPNTNTITVTASIANDGDMYRAAGTSGSGFFITWHEFSEGATLTVVEAPTVVFTTQPTDQTAIDGETATFTVAAEAYADGTEWTQFAWQVSSDGGANWFDVIGGPNTNTITVTASIANDGDMYRAAGTSGSGFFITWHEFSEAATLTIVEAPTVVFTTQPTDQTAIDGETATFTVAAESYADGSEWTQFAWQVSSDGGANWFDVIGGPNTNSITVTASIVNDGDMYRAAGTSGSGFFITWHEFSEGATLTVVEAPTVVFTTQPTDQTATDGETATFTVAAESYEDGSEWTQFAWQVSSDGGANWFDVIGGPNTNSITVTAAIANDGDMYRAAGTSGSGFFITWHEFSEGATLTVVEAPTVVFTTQPTDQTAIDGETATFTVAAESYEDGTEWTQFAWQVSSDGGANWFDVLGGSTTNTLTVTASIANDGDMYRAAGTSGSGFNIIWHEVSEGATLTVVEAPPVYALNFHVTDVDGNIEGATITIDGGDLITDADGNSTIELVDGDYAYSIVADGYDAIAGSVTIAGASVTEEVVMTESIVYYLVTFHVYDDAGDLENVTINIDGVDLLTNTDGIATIELVDGQYDYTASADGFDDYSGSITVSGDVVTEEIALVTVGIDDLNTANISVYPNPSTGIFYIDLDREFSLSVYDITGKIVYTNEMNANTEIDLSNQPSGIYIFKLFNKNELLTYRVIVE